MDFQAVEKGRLTLVEDAGIDGEEKHTKAQVEDWTTTRIRRKRRE